MCQPIKGTGRAEFDMKPTRLGGVIGAGIMIIGFDGGPVVVIRRVLNKRALRVAFKVTEHVTVICNTHVHEIFRYSGTWDMFQEW